MQSYKDQTALVTGASSGIGLALARSLADRGAHVILSARSADKLNEVAAELRGKGVKAHVLPVDLSSPGSAERLYKDIKAAGLTVDLLVNNAGYGRWGEFTAFEQDDYSRMLQLNINSLTELCRFFIPDMVARGAGGIINVGSTGSFLPVPFAAVYSASKAYVLMLSEALEYEYSPKGLRVMALCPGATESNFAQVAAPNATRSKSDTPELVATQGLDAFLKGKSYVITGGGNGKFAFLPRVLSRKRIAKMVGDNFRTRLEK